MKKRKGKLLCFQIVKQVWLVENKFFFFFFLNYMLTLHPFVNIIVEAPC